MIRNNKVTQNQETLKNLIDSSVKILLASEPSADEATRLAMFALKNVLESLGKEVFLHPAPGEKFKEKFKEILPERFEREIPQKIKIKIPKSSIIDELRYEEEENFLSVVVLPKGKIEPATIQIEKSPYDMDAAFCFFAPQDSSLGEDYESGWRKIAAPTAKPPGEKIVYLVNGEKTLAGKISDIHEAMDGSQSLPPLTATLLMASLVYETENFQGRCGPEAFKLANLLLELGADKKTLDKILLLEKDPRFVQIVGRALARTASETELKTSWTYLTKKDFEKTELESTKENLLFILRKIRAGIMPHRSSIICYESGGGIESLIFNEDRKILNVMAAVLGAEPESLYFFTSGFKNFSEAETKIRQLLKDNISDRMKE
ncbi:MAG: hypothetical protein HYY55_02940 [Candidatus Niyogibacteria bacterium]|nr:MAG: hypothetical protein HYY55_02940 [Candidatus Niyogibacteria bacterium]